VTDAKPDDEHRGLGALSAEDCRRLDLAAVEVGVPLEVLMEAAGWQVARVAWRMLGRAPGRVLVCAGRGNNGADALVAARHLATWGCTVDVRVALGDGAANMAVRSAWRRLHSASDLRSAHDDPMCGRATVTEVHGASGMQSLADAVGRSDVVVDGLVGTGLRGAPRRFGAACIAALEHARVLSIDVPSGLDADTGEAGGACVTALMTVTLTAMKQGLWEPQARAWAGVILVADIGMPSAAWVEANIPPPTAVRGGGLRRVRHVDGNESP